MTKICAIDTNMPLEQMTMRRNSGHGDEKEEEEDDVLGQLYPSKYECVNHTCFNDLC